MARMKAWGSQGAENQRIILLFAGLLVFLTLILGSGLFLLLQMKELRCYHIQQPYTYAEREIVAGNLLACAVVNCRLKVGLGANSAYTCYFRPASQPLPVSPNEVLELPVYSLP